MLILYEIACQFEWFCEERAKLYWEFRQACLNFTCNVLHFDTNFLINSKIHSMWHCFINIKWKCASALGHILTGQTFHFIYSRIFNIHPDSYRVSASGGCIEKPVLSLTKCRHYINQRRLSNISIRFSFVKLR